MKKIAFLIIALIFAVLLAACGSENNGDSPSKTDETTDYRSPSTIVYASDATPEQISEEINKNIDKDLLANIYKVDKEFVESEFDFSCVEDFVIYESATGSVDRYGVFKANDVNDAILLVSSVNAYVEKCKSTWMTEYAADDAAKLENAFIYNRGVYVAYAMLSKDDSEKVVTAINSLVKEVSE